MFVNLELWHFRRAVRIGLIEDWGNRWPKRVLWQVRRQCHEIWVQVRTFVPVGINRLAAYLRERTVLDATVTDIHELIKRSVLRPVGSYKGWDTFDPNDLDDLIEDDPAWLEWPGESGARVRKVQRRQERRVAGRRNRRSRV